MIRTWQARTWLAAMAVVLSAVSAFAQGTYPDKPVRFIVGFTAGSATDITARLFAQKFAEAWNVPVTVENVPGRAAASAATASRSPRPTARRSTGAPTAR